MSPNDTVVPANDVLFDDLCKMLDNVVQMKKKHEKSIIFMDFIDDFKLRVAKIPDPKISTFYPILRLLLPVLERERRSYNLKERRLGNKLVEALAWDKTSQNAQLLLNYKCNNRSGKDFAAVACGALKYTVSETSTLTVGDINEILDNIANVENGKPPTLEDIFTEVLKKVNVRQLKWLLRIILKDLKLNMGQTRIFAAFDSDAEKFYNYCSDLRKVCQEFDGGNTRLPEFGAEIYTPISPMLLTALPITKLLLLSPSKTYITEEKYDGERFQIHMKNHVFKYFTRRNHESHNFGKTYDSGMLTPLLKGCFAPDVESFILDGEMLGWNEEEGEYGSKGMNFDVKSLKEDSEYKPSFCAFDVLYYNGKSLVGPPENGGMTLIKRLEILDKIFKDVPEVITHSKVQTVKDILDIKVAFNKSVEEDKEGITVKDIESYYIANRRDASWFKIKGEYTNSTIQDLDLVIIGKTLKRRGSFYVACVDNSGASPRWLCMSIVGRLGHEQYGTLCARLRPYWRSTDTHPLPASLVFNKKHVDFWLPPEHSVVLQVRASELVKCDNYGTPYTLRFQRIIKVRYDKPVADIFTLQEFNQIISPNLSVVKLSKKINEEEIDSLNMIPHKKRVKKPLELAEPFRSKTTGEVIATSKALLGRKVYILSDDPDCDKTELVKIVESHGGKHTEKYGIDTWCCVAGRLTPYVKTLIHSTSDDAIDIATTSWLRSIPNADELCSLSPLDMLTIKKETKLKMSLDYDDFGDSYREPIDVDTLKRCFEKMDEDKPKVYLTIQEKIKVDKDLFPENNPFSYLRDCFLAFLRSESVNAIRARMYGANLCLMDSPNVTHLVLPKMASVDDKMAAKKFNVLVVTERWLEACFEERKRVPEHLYVES